MTKPTTTDVDVGTLGIFQINRGVQFYWWIALE